VAFVREQGYDVVGELDSLLVPDQLPERRRPDSVTDAEVAQVAVELVATMLGDVRRPAPRTAPAAGGARRPGRAGPAAGAAPGPDASRVHPSYGVRKAMPDGRRGVVNDR
jgi:hypothetical protein